MAEALGKAEELGKEAVDRADKEAWEA